MPALGVGHINFRPRWRKKCAAMVTMGSPERVERRLPGQMLKCSRGVDQTPVKEYPSCGAIGCGSTIGNRKLDGTPREDGFVQPWERRAVADQFLLHDAAAWLFHCGVAPSAELRQQRSLAAARAARDHYKTVAVHAFLFK